MSSGIKDGFQTYVAVKYFFNRGRHYCLGANHGICRKQWLFTLVVAVVIIEAAATKLPVMPLIPHHISYHVSEEAKSGCLCSEANACICDKTTQRWL